MPSSSTRPRSPTVTRSPRQAAAVFSGARQYSNRAHARHRAPQLAALVGLQPPPGPGPPDAAGVREPVVGRADGELRLGGAVELPDAAGRQGVEHRPLERRGAGRAGVHEPAERRPVDVRAASSRCRWVGTQNVVVGRSLGDRPRRPGRRRTGRAAARRPRPAACAIAKRSGALWCSGREHQVPVGRPEAPELDLLGGQPPGVVLGQDAGPHALAPPRRPRRVVHRPGQRHVGEVGLVVAEQLRRVVRRGRGRDRRPRRARPARPAGRPGSRTTGTTPVRSAPEHGGQQRG